MSKVGSPGAETCISNSQSFVEVVQPCTVIQMHVYSSKDVREMQEAFVSKKISDAPSISGLQSCHTLNFFLAITPLLEPMDASLRLFRLTNDFAMQNAFDAYKIKYFDV